MANRVLIGKRGNEYGLFISKPGVDVTSTTATGGLAFDSNVVESPRVVGYGQGILSPRTTGDQTFDGAKAIYTASPSASHNVRITHGLSYAPLIFVRWSYEGDLSSSKAARTYNVGHVSSTYTHSHFTGFGTNWYAINEIGMGLVAEVDSTYLYIASMEYGCTGKSSYLTFNQTAQHQKFAGIDIYYAYVITDSTHKGVML